MQDKRSTGADATPAARSGGAGRPGGPEPSGRPEPPAGSKRDDGAGPEGPGGLRREAFPILASTAYLNSNSLGALSERALLARRAFEADWNELGAAAWYERWLGELEAVRAAFGRTIGAEPYRIALMPSVSAALAAVAGALPGLAGGGTGRGPGGGGTGRGPEGGGTGSGPERNRVVITDLDFPTLGHLFLSRRSLGVEVRIVESPDGIEVPPEAIADAVDERTALVATSHVYYATGAVQDAAAVAEIARRAGALFLLDAYQSNGQLPIDAPALGVDFLVSGALKWLCGGPGLAYLYVRPELELAPTTLSWFGVEDPFAFDVRGAVPRSDARRFEMGTPAVGAAFTASGGLSIVEEVGIARIREANRALAEDLVARLRAAGFGPRLPPPGRRSALVLLPHPDAAGAVRHLAERGVIVDHRADRVRFSPHFYNTPEDNARAVEALLDHRLKRGGRSGA